MAGFFEVFLLSVDINILHRGQICPTAHRITFSDQRLNPSEILQMMDAFSLRAAR